MTRRKPPVRLTRRHAIQTFLAGVGSSLLPGSALRAWADLPWGEGPVAGLGLYFGDLHEHPWQCNGMGEPMETYLRARDVFRDDFQALTDHDHFVQKRLTDAQWEEQKAIAEHCHRREAPPRLCYA